MRFFQSLQNDGISAPAQIRLLNNTFLRLVFSFSAVPFVGIPFAGNDSNLLIVFYVQIMPDDFVMQLHRF